MKSSLLHHAYKIGLLRLLKQEGSLRKAALQAELSPSAFSQNMSALESFVGETLLVRNKSSIRLTSKGEALLEKLGPALEAFEVQSNPDEELFFQGKLTLGAYDSIALGLFPKLFPVLRKRYPNLKINILSSRSHQLIDRVRRGELDMALVIESPPIEGVKSYRICEERLGLWVSSHHEIASLGARAIDLHGLAVLAPGQDGFPLYYQRFMTPLKGKPIVMSSDSFETLKGLVLSGSVVGILPHRVAQRHGDQLQEITMATSAKSLHHIALVVRKNLDAKKVRNLVGIISELKY